MTPILRFIPLAITLAGCSNYPPGVYNAEFGKKDQSWLSEDKGAHAAAGLIASAVVATIAASNGADSKTAANVGCAAGIATGIGKEIYDWKGPGRSGYWETADAVATGLGGCMPRVVMEF